MLALGHWGWSLVGPHSRCRGRLHGADSAACAALRTPPSIVGSARTYPRDRERLRRVRVGSPGWKENHRPHSVSLAPLTSPAHLTESLPPPQVPSQGHPRSWEGWGCRSQIPRRCRPRSQRSCSSGARQRRPRCRHRCHPRWMSSRTWEWSGRRLLSLFFGLGLESCDEGVAVPIYHRRKQACQDHAVSEGQSWDSDPGSCSRRCRHGEGESAHSPLRTPTNCRLLGPGLGWAPGVPSLFFMMDLRMPAKVR